MLLELDYFSGCGGYGWYRFEQIYVPDAVEPTPFDNLDHHDHNSVTARVTLMGAYLGPSVGVWEGLG
jgi:hypothetical protein